jgi:hypothetical protein
MTTPEPEEKEQQKPPSGSVISAPGSGIVPGALLSPGAAAVAPPPAASVPRQPGEPGRLLPPPPRLVMPQTDASSTSTVGQPATPASPAATAPAARPAAGDNLVRTVRQATGAAAGQAAAAASRAAAPAAAAKAEGLAVADAGHSGPPGASPEARRGNGHARPSGRLARLRIGSHVVSRSALAHIRVSPANTGLILGMDRRQSPVLVRLFRPRPTRVALVGGVWAGQLVAFRALALGARAIVVTFDPYAWQGFGERATGQADRVSIITAEQPLALTGSVRQPVLVIYDQGVMGANQPQPLGPWQTQLTILRRLDQAGVSAVRDSDLVMLQRLTGPEATLAGTVLRLPAPSTQFLQVMANDVVALVGGGSDQYVWVTQTEVERQYAGAPRR